MGMLALFRCQNCGYEVMSSGGDDRGLAVRTTSIICRECAEIRDIELPGSPWEEEEVDPENLKCPVCGEKGREMDSF